MGPLFYVMLNLDDKIWNICQLWNKPIFLYYYSRTVHEHGMLTSNKGGNLSK